MKNTLRILFYLPLDVKSYMEGSSFSLYVFIKIKDCFLVDKPKSSVDLRETVFSKIVFFFLVY